MQGSTAPVVRSARSQVTVRPAIPVLRAVTALAAATGQLLVLVELTEHLWGANRLQIVLHAMLAAIVGVKG